MVTGSHISENVRTRIGIAHICWNLAYSVAMTSLEAAVNEWVDYLRVEKGASAHTVPTTAAMRCVMPATWVNAAWSVSLT